MKLIDKDALVAEIQKICAEETAIFEEQCRGGFEPSPSTAVVCVKMEHLLFFIDTLEVKEVDEQKERIDECPYRQVGCTMYKDKILECTGACGWVVDHPKLKELKAQKGE